VTEINQNQTEYEIEGVVIEADNASEAPPKNGFAWQKYLWLVLLLLLISLGWWLNNNTQNEPEQTAIQRQEAQQKLAEAKKIARIKQIERQKSREIIVKKQEMQQQQIELEKIKDDNSQEVKESAIKAIIKSDAESDKLKKMQLKLKQLKQKYADLEQVAQSNNAMILIYLELQNKLMADSDIEKYLSEVLENKDLPENIVSKLQELRENAAGLTVKIATLKEKLRIATHQYYEKNPIYKADNGFARWFNHHVKIKKVGIEHNDGDLAIIAKIDDFMQKGDLNAALNIAQSLSVHATPYFNEWQQLAYQHVNSKQAIQDLTKLMQHEILQNKMMEQ
jgi:hypothetical protein